MKEITAADIKLLAKLWEDGFERAAGHSLDFSLDSVAIVEAQLNEWSVKENPDSRMVFSLGAWLGECIVHMIPNAVWNFSETGEHQMYGVSIDIFVDEHPARHIGLRPMTRAHKFLRDRSSSILAWLVLARVGAGITAKD